MPRVVVYLPAQAGRDLVAEGFDPAEWVREKVKAALAEREGTRDRTAGQGDPEGRMATGPVIPQRRPSRSASADEVRPDFK